MNVVAYAPAFLEKLSELGVRNPGQYLGFGNHAEPEETAAVAAPAARVAIPVVLRRRSTVLRAAGSVLRLLFLTQGGLVITGIGGFLIYANMSVPRHY